MASKNATRIEQSARVRTSKPPPAAKSEPAAAATTRTHYQRAQHGCCATTSIASFRVAKTRSTRTCRLLRKLVGAWMRRCATHCTPRLRACSQALPAAPATTRTQNQPALSVCATRMLRHNQHREFSRSKNSQHTDVPFATQTRGNMDVAAPT
ncbi:MAG: hypothetical protein Ta2A_26870 [Treponemataceae bacterium]|nr:MAG: hypothetical protein Ta2A_26870 [Treponemataceae bacterium]